MELQEKRDRNEKKGHRRKGMRYKRQKERERKKEILRESKEIDRKRQSILYFHLPFTFRFNN